MTIRRGLMVALGTAAVLLIVGRTLAGVYADYLWYDSLGAISLWRARLSTIVWLRTGSALAGGLFAFANLYAVRQSVVSLAFPRRVGNLEIGEEVPGKYLMGAVIGLSLILGVLLALPQDDWTTAMLARSGRMFNESDPYFQADLGFFVYWLPFETTLWTWAFYTILVVGIAVVLLYALTPSLKWQRGSVQATAYVRRHFTVLVGILLFMLAWSFRLDMYSLLTDGSGPDGAFSYVDHRIGVPGDLLLSLTTLGAALIVIWAGAVGQFRLAGVSVLSVIVLSLLVREIAPLVTEHTVTELERTARERPYVATRAGYTRRAFAADAVTRADSTIAYPSLSAALPWVSVWDAPALTRALDATRQGGPAGAAAEARVGWQSSPLGMVGEVIEPPVPGASAHTPWTATHVLAADADERGAPMRLAGTNASAIDDTPLEPPVVYPDASPFVIIADSLKRTTGTPLETFVNRLASAWSLQNFRILTADLPEPHPTIISHRDIRERVALYTPFFAQGHRVEPLLVGDSLYWAIDLYSSSSSYPLSRHELIVGEDRSYLHHAAVAVVQASTGETVVVPDATLDPIASTWVHRLPGVFGTWTALPPGLPALLPPPIDGIYAQATAFGRYGTRTDSDLARHVPVIDGADSALASEDVPIALPGAASTTLVLPLVDEFDALRGLLVGTGGTNRVVAWYPLDRPGPRWSAVIDKLRTLDSAGSAAREGPLAHGRVRAVPVRAPSLIAFVQPSYRWRPQSPTLNRVALLSGDTTRSIIPPTAIGAGAQRSETGAQGASSEGGGAAAFRASVASLYAAMRDALRRGDWSAFGRAFDQLGRLLEGGGGGRTR